ncbi:MAG: hypothetical protein KDC66_08510 [Phaeodactylibacter sp.]|nr:hypothetical protein [Phaeodactylibacter sp.]
MGFAKISDLTLRNGSIDNGEGFIAPGHSFFYLEDIQRVLAPREANPNIRLSQLRIVSIMFDKDDGPNNHNRHEVTGLALLRSEPQFDQDGKITNTDWYDDVALAWPPYYITDSVELLTDDKEGFDGKRFTGSMDYGPGKRIFK